MTTERVESGIVPLRPTEEEYGSLPVLPLSVLEATWDDTGEEVLGSILPRLYVPPLVDGPAGPCGCGCALTPETSYGFAVAEFAEDILKAPLWPWQRWLVIHAGELLDGIPRFRRVIVTVGRQSGKTEVVLALTLFWLYVEEHLSILGTSTLTRYAKKPWKRAFEIAVKNRGLPVGGMRKAAGEEEWWTQNGSVYAIAAANAEGGRSMTNQRVIADEFAKQHNYDAYGAAYYSMEAVEHGQYWALTTPDPNGEPYNDLRGAALEFLRTEAGDPTLGLFEWSAEDDADPMDPWALAAANPTLGRPGGKRLARLLNEARAAVAKGGLLLDTFKTEIMCIQRASDLRPIDLEAWAASGGAPGSFSDLRGRLALLIEVSPNLQAASAYVGALQPDGRVRVGPAGSWDGARCLEAMRRDLPALLARVRPRVLGWFPSGPTAAMAADLADRSAQGRSVWPPPGITVEEIRGESSAVCMGLAEQIAAGKVWHTDDPRLNEQINAVEKARRGDAWVFDRAGGMSCEAVYAVAGVVHLARTMPPPAGEMRVLLPTTRPKR